PDLLHPRLYCLVKARKIGLYCFLFYRSFVHGKKLPEKLEKHKCGLNVCIRNLNENLFHCFRFRQKAKHRTSLSAMENGCSWAQRFHTTKPRSQKDKKAGHPASFVCCLLPEQPVSHAFAQP